MDQHSQIKKILNVILFTRTKEKGIKMMNNDMTVSEKKNRIVEQMSSISILPIKDESIMEDDNYTKIPYMTFLALGTGLEPVANLLQKAILGNDQSGLYWVRVPKGYAILVREEFSCLEFIMNRDTINWILKKLDTGGRIWSIYQRKSIKTASATRWWETTTSLI